MLDYLAVLVVASYQFIFSLDTETTTSTNRCQTSAEIKPRLLIEGHLKPTTFNSAGTLRSNVNLVSIGF